MPDARSVKERFPVEVRSVRAPDGVELRYDVQGTGTPLVVVSGALNRRQMFKNLSSAMCSEFRVVNYDRRGRGGSQDGDPDRYAYQREVDDLAAVINDLGEAPFVLGNCTGSILVAHASVQGIPMRRLVMYEPPYAVGGGKAPIPPDVGQRLRAMIREGRVDDAVVAFQREVVGMTRGAVDQFQLHPAWGFFANLAHTLPYDIDLSGDGSVPVELFTGVRQPTLVIGGGRSPEWQQRATKLVSLLIPEGQELVLAGCDHIMPQDGELITEVRTFFRNVRGAL